MPIVYLTRRALFSASHRLVSAALSESENRQLFGKCNSLNGHGHNYVLEVTLRGPIDPKTGILFDLSALKRILEEHVVERLDHKNLNLDIPEFNTLNPTSENIAIVCWKWIVDKLPKGMLFEIRLQETENNSTVYRGE